jgi:hypothetical protein
VVQRDILEKIASSHLTVFTVWLPVLEKDGFHAAERARMTLPDARVQHFWDGEAKLGHDYHRALSLATNCRMAWDVYLLFRAQIKWQGSLPLLPTFWMHQLSCMSKELYLNSEVFRGEIERMLAKSQAAQER